MSIRNLVEECDVSVSSTSKKDLQRTKTNVSVKCDNSLVSTSREELLGNTSYEKKYTFIFHSVHYHTRSQVSILDHAYRSLRLSST